MAVAASRQQLGSINSKLKASQKTARAAREASTQKRKDAYRGSFAAGLSG